MRTIRKRYETIKRNETCPCESGLKYKNCCLKEIHAQEQVVYENIHRRHRAVQTIMKASKEVKIGRHLNSVTDSPLILPDSARDKETKIIIP